MIAIPEVLARSVRLELGHEDAARWIRALPDVVDDLLARWKLTVESLSGTPWAGYQSIVLPVRTVDGVPAALRVASPIANNPAAHQQLRSALETWDGFGSVRLMAADAGHNATLLERLDQTIDLNSVPLQTAASMWGGVVRALSRPAPPGLVTVQGTAQRWIDDFPGKAAQLLPSFRLFTGTDNMLVQATLNTARALATAPDAYLVHADLHYSNVLSSHPDPANGQRTWKAIDPYPVSGPVAFAVAPMLWNRLAEVPANEPEEQAAWLRAHCTSLCHAAGIDPAQGAAVSVAREIENLFWYLADFAQGDQRAHADAARSLWVARAISGHSVGGIDVHSLAGL
ncbi:aminoglycoside phosphotransferase family protein [Saxibacter everestensis]|uniref:Aminoglycoside phosphotransferase family protein n=1 Tax=Saxibacter everestensis TaxID=2909229 RepID=A0ABY8QVP9_9MICO|nr:aminoglycoside phosphotransferase family protein [Brevibacteriaceae bacterium ZFBP1038]